MNTKLERIVKAAITGIAAATIALSGGVLSCANKQVSDNYAQDIVTSQDIQTYEGYIDKNEQRESSDIRDINGNYINDVELKEKLDELSQQDIDTKELYDFKNDHLTSELPKIDIKKEDYSALDAFEVFQETKTEVLACIDNDGDGYGSNCELGPDCNDSKTWIHGPIKCDTNGEVCEEFEICGYECPEYPLEICNEIDDDCDGLVDEDYVCWDCQKYGNAFSFYPEYGMCCFKYPDDEYKGNLIPGKTTCISDEVELPDFCPTDLTWDGHSFWFSDAFNKKIHKVTLEGIIVESFDSPGQHPKGITWDGEYLWNGDPEDMLLYKITTKGEIIDAFEIELEKYPYIYQSFGNIAWDGENLLVIMGLGVFKISTSGEIILTSDIPSVPTGGLKGIEYHEGYIYLSDTFNQSVIYKLTPDFEIVSAYDYQGYGGLAWQGDGLWQINDWGCQNNGITKVMLIDN